MSIGGSGTVDDGPGIGTRAGNGRSSTSPRQRLAGMRVLVVEDEPDARELVGALLEGGGAEVDLAESAAQAYELLSRAVPDIIVSDIGMPDEDGYDFARRVRTLPRERGGRTPMVALTAYTSAQDRQRTAAAGYDHHLAKPIDIEELLRTLERLGRGP
jgi:CheY-like chemotaxis protein